MSTELTTVNVIEQTEEYNYSIKSFADTPEGNKEAEEYFSKIYKQHYSNLREVEDAIDDGISTDGSWVLLLIHSN